MKKDAISLVKMSPKQTSNWRTSFTKAMTFMAGSFFFCSSLLTPTGGVPVGWPFFLATYGVTLVIGLLGLAGFLLARIHGERISAAYARCCSLFVFSVFLGAILPI
jgi:hypothetical protein